MVNTSWTTIAQHSHATIATFSATISVDPQTGYYKGRVISQEDNIIVSFDDGSDFEEAELRVLVAIIDSEQEQKNIHPNHGFFETLQLCSRKIQAQNIHQSHSDRIQHLLDYLHDTSAYLKKYYKNFHFQQTNDQSDMFIFDWINILPGIWTNETPFGQAVIEEVQAYDLYTFGTPITHATRIIGINSVIIEPKYTYSDFMEAERWIQQQIHDLHNPNIGERFLPCIFFTLDICATLLLDDDIIHKARIDYLRGWLEISLE